MPYYILPPSESSKRHDAPFILAGIMLFPDDGGSDERQQLIRAMAAQRYKALLPRLSKLRPFIAEAVLQSGEGQAIRDRCAKFVADLERRGFPGITIVPRPEADGVRLKLYVDPDTLQEVERDLCLGTWEERVQRRLAKCGRDAWIAASTLMNTLGLAERMPKRASLGISRNAISIALGGSGGGGSLSNMADAWKKFKSVAHLWAAYWSMNSGGTKQGGGFPCNMSELGEFLCISENLRVSGESFTPYRASEPLLDERVTWKLHPSIQVAVQGKFEFGPVPESVRQVLDGRNN